MQDQQSAGNIYRRANAFFGEQWRDVLLLMAFFALPSAVLSTMATVLPSRILGRSVLLIQLIASGLFLACIMSFVLRTHAWLADRPENAKEITQNLNSIIGPYLTTILAQVVVMAVPLFVIILIAVLLGGSSRTGIADRLWLTALIGLVLLGAQFLFFYSWPMIAVSRIAGFRNIKKSGKLAGQHPGLIFTLLIPLTAVYVIRLMAGGDVHPALSIIQTVLGGLAMLVTVVLQTIAFYMLHGPEMTHD